MAYPYDDDSDWPDDEEHYIIVPDYPNEDMPDDFNPYTTIVDFGYGGSEIIYWHGINQETTATNRTDGIFTYLNGGYVSFGETVGGVRTTRSSIQPTTIDSYPGIAIDSPKVDINARLPSNYQEYHSQIEVGSDIGLTGYLKAIVAIRGTQEEGPQWIIYNIPFINGICVWDGT